jgi:hypothetical protein
VPGEQAVALAAEDTHLAAIPDRTNPAAEN